MTSAFEQLAPLASRGMVLNLDAMREALTHFGHPERDVDTVHIAGTNGKGSVAAMTASVLGAAGRRVGLYTSPHLHRFAERINIAGSPIDDGLASRLTAEVLAAVARGAIAPLTFFEAATVLAWRAFRAEGCDAVVLEVGLGGRLDATTVCAPTVCAITRIARDHEAILGDSLEAIAAEKAGILKPGVPCVLGPSMPTGVRRTLGEAASRVGAPLIDAQGVRDDGAGWRLPLGGGLKVPPVLGGAYQRDNVAVVAGLVAALRASGVAVDDAAVAAGLGAVRWPGRYERVGRFLLDAAHNPDGLDALVAAVRREGLDVGAAVFGASRDKDQVAMTGRLAALLPPARRFFAAAPMPRAEAPSVLAGHHGGVVCEGVAEALAQAEAVAGEGQTVLVCGSIFVVAAARAALMGVAQEPFVGL